MRSGGMPCSQDTASSYGAPQVPRTGLIDGCELLCRCWELIYMYTHCIHMEVRGQLSGALLSAAQVLELNCNTRLVARVLHQAW